MSHLEIPLAFPALPGDKVPRYVVKNHEDDDTIVWEPYNPYHETSALARVDHHQSTTMMGATVQLLKASSGILCYDSHVVTTCVLVDEPHVLNVSCCRASSAAPVSSLEIDLASLQDFEVNRLVKTDIMLHHGTLRVLLVDADSHILTLWLDAKTLLPNHDHVAAIVHVPRLLSREQQGQTRTTPLMASMVAVVDVYHVILPCYPFLLTVRLSPQPGQPAACWVWSKTATLERMQHASSSWRAMLSLTSRSTNTKVLDMKHVAAIGVSSDVAAGAAAAAAGPYARGVCTLHADGMLHHWRLPLHATKPPLPDQVYELPPVPEHLRPHLWHPGGDDAGTISPVLLCRQDKSCYTVVLALVTTEPVREAYCHVMLWDGTVVQDDHHIVTRARQPLTVPTLPDQVTTNILDVTLAKASAPTTASTDYDLLVMYGCSPMDDLTLPPCTRVLARYPSSIVDAMLLLTPELVTPGPDTRAVREWHAWQQASVSAALWHDCDSVDDACHIVDKWFLSRLFRGPSPPPRASHLMRALRKVPDYYYTIEESDVVATTEEDVARLVWQVAAQFRSNDMQIERAARLGNNFRAADDDQEMTDDTVALQVAAHEQCWRSLCLQIWQEEEVERQPLKVGFAAAPRLDTIVVVRGRGTAAWCRLELTAAMESSALMRELDSMALNLVASLGTHPPGDLAGRIHDTMYEIRLSLESGQLAMRGDAEAMRLQDLLIGLASNEDLRKSSALDTTKATQLMTQLIRMAADDSGMLLRTLMMPISVAVGGWASVAAAQHLDTAVRDMPSHVTHSEQILASVALAMIQAVMDIQDLALGRVLLLAGTDPTCSLIKPVFAALLHATSVANIAISRMDIMWDATHATNPARADWIPGEKRLSRKRPSLEGTSLVEPGFTVRPQTSSRTGIEVLLMSITRNEPSMGVSGDVGSYALALCQAALRVLYNQTSPLSRLPELRLLSHLTNASNSHLAAMQLHAVFLVAMPNATNTDDRRAALGQCLMKYCHSSDLSVEKVNDVAHAALSIFPFDVDKLESSLAHLYELQGIISHDKQLAGLLHRYTSDAIAEMQAAGLEEDQSYSRLWSNAFDAAIKAAKWTDARIASRSQPDLVRRAEDCRRLVRRLVLADEIDTLKHLCRTADRNEADGDFAVDFTTGHHFYGIAAETLVDLSLQDWYLTAAMNPEKKLPDYVGALYTIHAAMGQWRRAAQAMDLRWMSALKAWRQRPTQAVSVPKHVQDLRGAIIVNELVDASFMAAHSMRQVADTALQFLVSGEYSLFPSVSLVPQRQSTEGFFKRNWESDYVSIGLGANDETELTREDRYMTPARLVRRAARCKALQVLYYDEIADNSISELAHGPVCFTDENSIDSAIATELFRLGHIVEGVHIAKAVGPDLQPHGKPLFASALELLLGDLVVLVMQAAPSKPPLPTDEAVMEFYRRAAEKASDQASDMWNGTGNKEETGTQSFAWAPALLADEMQHRSYSTGARMGMIRPTQAQLEKAWWKLSGAPVPPALANCDCIPGYQKAWYARREVTEQVIKCIIQKYARTNMPLAKFVAEEWLEHNPCKASRLPEWLEEALCWGHVPQSQNLPGLFARRGSAQTSGLYLGNPPALIQLYMNHARYLDAGRVVRMVLDVQGRVDRGGFTSRLPEKGQVEYVPYTIIDGLVDVLSHLKGNAAQYGLDAGVAGAIKDECEWLLADYDKHFELLKASEDGLASARALQS